MAKKSESLVLQNSEFAENHVDYYRELMEYKEMTDITLACDDDSSIEAHKFILCASSPFFKNIIRNSRHQSPYVYLKGIKIEDLQALITFMYTGETKIKANEIKRFLTTAHELKVAGLIKNMEEGVGDKVRIKQEDTPVNTLSEEVEPGESPAVVRMIEDIENELECVTEAEAQGTEKSSRNRTESESKHKDESMSKGENKTEMKEKTKRGRPRKEKTYDAEVLKKEINTRITYVFDRALQKPVYVCKECNLTFPFKRAAAGHVEVHLNGSGVICTNCGAMFSGAKTLADHSETCTSKVD